jgi:hypothetical protein
LIGALGLRAVTIGRDGTPAFPERLSWDGRLTAHPAMAWNGTMWLFAWESAGSYSTDVQAARANASLQPLDPLPIAITESAFPDEEKPAVADDRSGFVVAWQRIGLTEQPPAIQAVRVSAGGVASDPIAVAAVGSAPFVDVRDGEARIAWISGADDVVAPLRDPSARTLLVKGASPATNIVIDGDVLAYDRICAEETCRGVARGFLAVTVRWRAVRTPRHGRRRRPLPQLRRSSRSF